MKRHPLPFERPDPPVAPDPSVERLAFVIRLLFVAGLAVSLVVLDAIDLPKLH